MKIWIDAQLSPAIVRWMNLNFDVEAFAVRELGLRDAEDEEIFLEAKKENAVVMIKDSDFLTLLDRFGAPPKIIWLTCGNTSNAALKNVLTKHLSQTLAFLEGGEDLVEING